METLKLESGQCMLISAKGVKGGKVQLTFAQQVELEGKSTNVLALLNADDERFSQSKPRYCWLTASPAMVKEHFDVDVTSLVEGEELEIRMLNPTLAGQPLNIQITETTEGTEFERTNFEKSAKRAGKDGEFILSAEGGYIYTHVNMVPGKPNHTFLTGTKRASAVREISHKSIDEALARG